jgi:hypothetical protein
VNLFKKIFGRRSRKDEGPGRETPGPAAAVTPPPAIPSSDFLDRADRMAREAARMGDRRMERQAHAIRLRNRP